MEEDLGNVTVNKDCTGTAISRCSWNGQLQRTAVLALIYDSDGNHARMIFQSLTLPDNTNVPVVSQSTEQTVRSKHRGAQINGGQDGSTLVCKPRLLNRDLKRSRIYS